MNEKWEKEKKNLTEDHKKKMNKLQQDMEAEKNKLQNERDQMVGFAFQFKITTFLFTTLPN